MVGWKGLTNILPVITSSLSQAQMLLVQTVIPAIDGFLYAIYPALGPNAFSGFLSSLNSLFLALGSFAGWMVTSLGYATQMVTQVFLWLVNTFSYMIYVFVRVIDVWIQFWSFVVDIFTGVYDTGVDIWTEWAGEQWVYLAIIFYPLWIFERCVQDYSWQPLEWHVNKWKDIFAFIFTLFKSLFEITLGIIKFVIESIPVVE